MEVDYERMRQTGVLGWLVLSWLFGSIPVILTLIHDVENPCSTTTMARNNFWRINFYVFAPITMPLAIVGGILWVMYHIFKEWGAGLMSYIAGFAATRRSKFNAWVDKVQAEAQEIVNK